MAYTSCMDTSVLAVIAALLATSPEPFDHRKACPDLTGVKAVIQVVTPDEIQRMAGRPAYGDSIRGLYRQSASACEIFVTWEGLHNASTVAHELCHCKKGSWHP